MRSISMWLLVTLIATVSTGKNAFAITSDGMENLQPSTAQVEVKESSVIYLLDWKDNKIHTNKGVFVTDGVEVVNHSGIGQERMATADPPPIVELVVENGMVKKLIILKNK